VTCADSQRWNDRYAAGNPNPEFVPDDLLVQHAQLFGNCGVALDVACGVGHNALYLARRGCEVFAIDASLTALRYCRRAARAEYLGVYPICADLDRFPLPARNFDVILVSRFLNRALIPQLKQALIPGGLLLYQTFNVNRLRTHPDFRRQFLLERGELVHLFADFDLLDTNDGAGINDDLTHWIGRRPTDP